MTGPLQNWAGNVAFTPDRLHRPTSTDELQRLVAGADRIRALGTGHSFNRIADSAGALVSLADLPRAIEIDRERSTVRVGGGVRYGEVAALLSENGLALHNLGSLPHISVAGACSTGTHGSGDLNGNLATMVSAVELVTSGGDITRLSRAADGDRFRGAVIGLGSLGILSSLTLDVLPAYDVRQYVYEGLPFDRLDEHFAEILGSAYSVSMFTDWQSPRINQIWLKHRVDQADTWRPEPVWLGATLATEARNPLPGLPGAICTQQLGVRGPWSERLPHFRLEFTPSNGEELQSEYLVPREHGLEALHSVAQLGAQLAPVLMVSEIRTVAADDLWMSPCFARDTVALHFTWIKDAEAVAPVLLALEKSLAPLAARPHWGKLFAMDETALRPLYPRFADFEQLMRSFDPTGKFRNEFVDRCFGTPQATSA
jgi:alditol oxidase